MTVDPEHVRRDLAEKLRTDLMLALDRTMSLTSDPGTRKYLLIELASFLIGSIAGDHMEQAERKGSPIDAPKAFKWGASTALMIIAKIAHDGPSADLRLST